MLFSLRTIMSIMPDGIILHDTLLTTGMLENTFLAKIAISWYGGMPNLLFMSFICNDSSWQRLVILSSMQDNGAGLLSCRVRGRKSSGVFRTFPLRDASNTAVNPAFQHSRVFMNSSCVSAVPSVTFFSTDFLPARGLPLVLLTVTSLADSMKYV